MKKFWLILIGVLTVIGVLIFAGIQIKQQGHHVITYCQQDTHHGVDLKNVEIAPTTPQNIVLKLNNEAFNLKQSANGLVTDDSEQVTGDTVTYTIKTDKRSQTILNLGLRTNGDKIDELGRKIIQPMQASGAKHSKLVINVTNDARDSLKSLTYR